MSIGPVFMSDPKNPRTSRNTTLRVPVRGDSNVTHPTAPAAPGISNGTSGRIRASHPMRASVRSFAHAKAHATTTARHVLVEQIKAVFLSTSPSAGSSNAWRNGSNVNLPSTTTVRLTICHIGYSTAPAMPSAEHDRERS